MSCAARPPQQQGRDCFAPTERLELPAFAAHGQTQNANRAMKLSLLDQIIVVLYLAAIMIIGFAMKRRAARGMTAYFLG